MTSAGGLALAALGCATAGGRIAAPATPVASPTIPAVESDAGAPGQWLFRAEISGDEGSGSVRLLLRRRDVDRFTLQAADAAGQVRWELRREGDRAIWLDPQAKLYCRLDPRLPLRASLSLPGIPVADLPGLLTGDWPPIERVAAAPAAASEDRPFTGERREADTGAAPGGRSDAGDGLWRSWTLWQAGEPVAWFKRLEAESLLSVRRPSVQMRWRLSARGGLKLASFEAATTWPGELPAGVQERACPGNEIP